MVFVFSFVSRIFGWFVILQVRCVDVFVSLFFFGAETFGDVHSIFISASSCVWLGWHFTFAQFSAMRLVIHRVYARDCRACLVSVEGY